MDVQLVEPSTTKTPTEDAPPDDVDVLPTRHSQLRTLGELAVDHRHIVLVAGAIGSGKTWLVHEHVRQTRHALPVTVQLGEDTDAQVGPALDLARRACRR